MTAYTPACLPSATAATIAVDEAASKVACMAAVPEADVGTLAANNWLKAVLDEVDGRGGGKGTSAQGSGSAVENLPNALEKAREVAEDAFA